MPQNEIKIILKALGSKQVQGELNKVKGAFGKLRDSSKRLKDSLFTLKGAFFALGAGVVARQFVSTVTQFESAMTNVATLVDTSVVNMQRFSKEVISMSTRVNKSAKDLADGLYQVISAGVDASEALVVLEVSAKAAKAGLTTTEQAVLTITKALNIYNLNASDASYVSDLLFKTIEKGQTTFPQLATQIGRILPFAKNLGVSMEDALSVFAGMTTILGTTEQAATALEATFRAFITSGQKFRDAGLDINKILAEEGMVGALKALKQLTGGNAESLRKLGIETEALRGILGLFGGKLEDVVDNLEEMEKASGATEAAFKKQMDTAQSSMDAVNLAFQELALTMSGEGLPAIKNISKAIVWAMKAFIGFGKAIGEGTYFVTKAFGIILRRVNLVINAFMDWAKIAYNVAKIVTDALTFNWEGVKKSWNAAQTNFRNAGIRIAKALTDPIQAEIDALKNLWADFTTPEALPTKRGKPALKKTPPPKKEKPYLGLTPEERKKRLAAIKKYYADWAAMKANLTDKLKQLTLSETNYAKWKLNEFVKKNEAAYGDMLWFREYVKAEKIKIIREEVEAEKQAAEESAEAYKQSLQQQYEHGSTVYESLSAKFKLMTDEMDSDIKITTDFIVDSFKKMEQTFSDVFYDAMTGKLKSLQDYWRAFSQAVMRMLSQMIAKALIAKAVGALGGGIFHQGGVVMHQGGMVPKFVPRFHTGGLAGDERMIIAQTGEGVLSRRGMQALGDLNKGNAGRSSPPVIVNMNVSAMDASSFGQFTMQNKEALAEALGAAMADNNPIRRSR